MMLIPEMPLDDDARDVNWVIVNLSSNYLYSSFQFAALCKDLESQGEVGDEMTRLQHRCYALGAVSAAAAFLESCINELFTAARERLGFPYEAGDESRLRFESIWAVERFRLARLLEKYETALLLAERSPFDRGASPFQDAQLLLQLRNALVHYAPARLQIVDGATEDMNPDIFAKRLGERFQENPWAAKFMLITPTPEPRETVWPYFPERCLGSGCAAWAATSSLRFADEFFDRLGAPPPYAAVRDRLPELSAG